MDPLASNYSGWSPYNYCLNNPVIYFDPNGTTVYKDTSGNVIYDDGDDNGAEVITTQDIITKYTENGTTDWHAVANDHDSRFNITNQDKFDVYIEESTEFLKRFVGAFRVEYTGRLNFNAYVREDVQQGLGLLEWITPGPFKSLSTLKGLSNSWNYFQHINKGSKVTNEMYATWKATRGYKQWQKLNAAYKSGSLLKATDTNISIQLGYYGTFGDIRYAPNKSAFIASWLFSTFGK